jgi:uncharacterized membrane-anchored protein YitT (DUF2179 family)
VADINLRRVNWAALIWQIFLLVLGSFISALAVIMFEAPYRIAPGGVSGAAVILNDLFGLPIGVMVLIGNIPIQILAFRMLGGWRALAATIFTLVLYSIMIDLLTPYFPADLAGEDVFLAALFGGIVGGIGAGLIYRAGGTLGGTSTLGRILQQKYGIPLSSSSLYTDTFVIAAAGLAFNWQLALYAMVTLFVAGAVADYILEGPSVVRTAVVITDHPREVADVVLDELGRGVTGWQAQGMFTEQPHTLLYITISRGQVNQLRGLVLQADPRAFVVIGQAHSAYGHGFREMKAERLAAQQDA